MIKLCIDNTSRLHEFHLYEPYLYGVMKEKRCFLVNDFSKDNSDIDQFDITIRDAENILIDHPDETYEVTVITEYFEEDKPLPQKLYEIDKYITRRFLNNRMHRAKNVTVIILDYTGNSYVDFTKNAYISNEESTRFFSRSELKECERILKETKDREEFVTRLKELRIAKDATPETEWYFFLFDKMIEHFYDEKLFSLQSSEEVSFDEIFAKIMSYYVKTELLDNKLIFRYDMSSGLDYKASTEKSFIDMNKLIGLLTFDMENLLLKSKKTLLKGIYDVHIGLDEEKVKAMILQYSENLKEQLQYLFCNKKNIIEVEKRIMPNISLRNIFLEPVRVKNERLAFFKSSRDLQYLDKIEKNTVNAINKRYMRVKKNNVQNTCDLRTLRYTEDRNWEMEKVTLIELNDKILDKTREYQKKDFEVYNNKVDYYEILEAFLKRQKFEKEKIQKLMERKVSFWKFLLSNIALGACVATLALMSSPELLYRIGTKEIVYITIGAALIINFLTSLGVLALDNFKINRAIDKYFKIINEYNTKLQIGSDEEINKLSRTYELILLNSDIEYYQEKYNELVADISKYEFHISQLEKHINIAKRLCERIGINFEEIVIANDTKHDEIIADIDVNKDVYANECYNIMHFLFDSKDYCLMLNSGEVLEQLSLKTYIKSINFVENEVYKF